MFTGAVPEDGVQLKSTQGSGGMASTPHDV
jgi:hypothetical protein